MQPTSQFLKDLKNEINKNAQWASQIYQQLHQQPRLSGQEHDTADLVRAVVAEIATKTPHIPVRIRSFPAGNGLIITAGEIEDDTAIVGVRAELDALENDEATDLEFRSLVDGVMHACGHDGHVVVSLLILRVYLALRDRYPEMFPAALRVVAQPGEEKKTTPTTREGLPIAETASTGGEQAIEAGALDGEPTGDGEVKGVVSAMLAMHWQSEWEAGQVAVGEILGGSYISNAGYGSVRFDVESHGGHGSRALRLQGEHWHRAAGALQIISAMNDLFPDAAEALVRKRHNVGQGEGFYNRFGVAVPTVADYGKPLGAASITSGGTKGTASNVFATAAWAVGTVRGFDDADYNHAFIQRAARLVLSKGVANGLDLRQFRRVESSVPRQANVVRLTVTGTDGCPTIDNAPAVTEVVRSSIGAAIGPDRMRRPFLRTGSDDVAVYLRQVPGCMVGIAPDTPDDYPLSTPRGEIHTNTFRPTQSAMLHAAFAMSAGLSGLMRHVQDRRRQKLPAAARFRPQPWTAIEEVVTYDAPANELLVSASLRF